MDLQPVHPWQQAQPILEALSALSYRSGELDAYLQEIAASVSHLLELDWSVVTLCEDEIERVMASSIDMGDGDHVYSLHGLLTETVVKTGRTLCVENAKTHPEYGCPPEGYVSYLGVPLRTYVGKTIGTICSFCIEPRLFAPEEVRTVELFAERAATAIDNYYLYQQQQKFNEVLEAEVINRTEELRLAQAQLIERERLAAIGEFASTIVHEIRNPVTTMVMGLNYFKKTYTSEPDQARVSLALEEADRLQNLLKEILLYAKPQTLQLEELDLNALMESMLWQLREMPEAAGKQIKFLPESTKVTILADKDKLKQVTINLIKNACEAIPAESCGNCLNRVVTCKIELETNGDRVCISVHNRGTPIPADLLPRLTQPFCSGKVGGTGLGLAIVKRIVDAHGGVLSIQSDKSVGTEVNIRLPNSSPKKT
ncbi:GAF domain-containing sensor histidine kinase [Merismopedia glauca]|uniref:histidine kinase n=2 Tax=Merismopedia TaxID=53402 RepID=A0A2T1C6T3_9CYAN|nr:GAF domain-containing sensor histidine kinase [Merismopedia glauca]PSB03853.1 ATPase [Merismopedia glauca CCAP 1448/3]